MEKWTQGDPKTLTISHQRGVQKTAPASLIAPEWLRRCL
jgi:hypothetical protein